MRAETFTPYRGHEPPRLFSWHVATTAGQERGACGVAVERARAVQGVTEAMRALSGSHGVNGVVQICRLSWLGPYYEYGLVIARAELDEAGGVVVWRDELWPDTGSDMGVAVTDRMPVEANPGGREPGQRPDLPGDATDAGGR